MANIVKTTDFIKPYEISQNSYGTNDLINFIAEFEHIYCEMLLGTYLYELLKADLNTSGVPQTQKYKDLVDGVIYTDCDGIKRTLRGLKKTLIQLLFVDFTMYPVYNSNLGNVQSVSENATVLSYFDNKKYLIAFSQDGVKNYREIIKYLKDDNIYLTYFTDTEFCNWIPQKIYPIQLIGRKTYYNQKYLRNESI